MEFSVVSRATNEVIMKLDLDVNSREEAIKKIVNMILDGEFSQKSEEREG